MEQALAMGEEERAALREKAMARVRERYSWDAVTGEYERLLRGMASGRGTATAL
jgi:glycosyltransferase involved in cell wall biosynthesis